MTSRLLAAVGGGGGAAASAWFFLNGLSSPAHASQPPPDELKLVQVVFRHGARSPLGRQYWPELVDAWDVCGQEIKSPVPLHITTEQGDPRPVNSHDNDQVKTILKGGCAKGELTRVGQKQALELGRWLRKRYVQELGFLPQAYEPGSVLCRTTNYSRTVATLQGVMTGLYSTVKSPIPVHTTEELDEILFSNVKSCERLGQVIKELTSQRNTAMQTPELQNLAQRVRRILNVPESKTINFVELHDAMTSMRTHGKELPKGMYELLDEIEAAATKRFTSIIAPEEASGRKEEVLRLGLGRLMELMIHRMKQAAAENGDERGVKLFGYSGHDSTLMPILSALVGGVDHWPEYISNLVFELWQQPNGDHYVKVLYNTRDLPMSCRFCGGSQPTVGLKHFEDYILGPYLLTKDAQENECAVLHFSHDKPAGENVREVKVGSSMEEEDDTKP